MAKRYEFIEQTLFLIRKILEKKLPKDVLVDELIDKRNLLLRKFIKENKNGKIRNSGKC